MAGMISVGGITRLTRSGLSMTDWKLQGSLPPMNDAEWETEFERYKQFPEWRQRQSMTMADFKFIYFWEYGHRMMGRGIGLAFALPALYFASRGMIPRHMAGRIAGLFCLGGTQVCLFWVDGFFSGLILCKLVGSNRMVDGEVWVARKARL